MIGRRFSEYVLHVLHVRLLDVLEERLICEHVADGAFLKLRSRTLRNGLPIVQGMTDVRRLYYAVVLELNSTRSRRLVQQTGDTLVRILKDILKPLVLRILMNIVFKSHVLHVVKGARPNGWLFDLAQMLARSEVIGIVSRMSFDEGR